MGSIKATINVQNSTVSAGSGSDYLGIVGYSTAGPLGDFFAVNDTAALAATYGTGPLVMAAEVALRAGKRVALYREATPTFGYGAAATVTGNAGTLVAADVTYDATIKPSDRSFTTIKFGTSGTFGVAGITYQYARKYNPGVDAPGELVPGDYNGAEIALGTALFITTPDGQKINFATGKTVTANARVNNLEGLLPVVPQATTVAAIGRIATSAFRIRDLFVIDDVTNAKLLAFSAALDLLSVKGIRPTVYVQVAQATWTQAPAAWQTAVGTVVNSVTDPRIVPMSSEAEVTSLLTGRSSAMYPTILSMIDFVARCGAATDPRGVAKPQTLPGETVGKTADLAGQAIQRLRADVVPTPIGGWDDAAAGDVLSALRVGSLRFVAGFPGNYISDAPVLTSAAVAINNAAHARCVSVGYELAYKALITYAAQNYPTWPAGTPGGLGGCILPFAVDIINEGIETAILNSAGGIFNAVTFELDPSNSISDGQASGVLTLDLFNVIVQFTVTAVVRR